MPVPIKTASIFFDFLPTPKYFIPKAPRLTSFSISTGYFILLLNKLPISKFLIPRFGAIPILPVRGLTEPGTPRQTALTFVLDK